MSHEDAVVSLPRNFKLIASTKNSKFTIIENEKKKLYGVQFHPEVTHTDKGYQLLKNFVFLICEAKKKMECKITEKNTCKSSKTDSPKDKVICALSGGRYQCSCYFNK